MIVSLIVVAFALLITYWWASSGAWSALLHLICVIVSGAVAFALWEPIAYLLLPQGMSGYAFGLTLLGLFLVLLVGTRLAMDRLIPTNLQPPRWAEFTFGGIFGAASGLLTMGMIVIGCGFVQSTAEIGDVSGYVRRSDEPKPPAIGCDNAPVLWIARATTGFYGFLSWGSFTPWLGGGTINTHQPELVQTSLSLFRDSFGNGMARVALKPDSVTGITLIDAGTVPLAAGEGARPEAAYAVSFKVDQGAFDGGGMQFILSASQARLIGEPDNGKANVVHPVSWIQDNGSGPATFFFTSPTTYATSQPPGAGDATFVLLFPKAPLEQQEPAYFQLKGVRFPVTRGTGGVSALAGMMKGSVTELVQDPGATPLISQLESPSPQYSLKTVLNANEKRGLVLDDENFIVGGGDIFDRNSSGSVSSDLRIKGFKPPEGGRLIRLDASARTGGARLYPELNEWVRSSGAEAQDARVAVVDDRGSKYYVLGYAEDDGQKLSIKSAAGTPLRLRDIPIQSLSDGKTLYLYFGAPEGGHLKYLILDTPKGMRIVNTLDFTVKASAS